MSDDRNDHDQALAAIRRSQETVRQRVTRGSWLYDLSYSAIAAVMVAGQALPIPFNVLASVGGAVCLALLWKRWSDKNGVSVTGLSPRRARWAALLVGLLLGALMVGALYLGHTDQAPWALALGAVAFVIALALSRLWMRLYLAEGEARS
ncbi:hypothetical protein [Brevundimonas sp. PAMC22021]|uniref:hypothetical protein n=1 Tax=Brevundimonas sp. PAMC22021 TaxID=2861285 RepID=UPI001C6283CC|nr:hypothetical protein [Brevundimonas sp. PAMC22021]QYF88117.1 hypothetical protein KY493_06535 [Brevundimonas sp. PAMC22021]